MRRARAESAKKAGLWARPAFALSIYVDQSDEMRFKIDRHPWVAWLIVSGPLRAFVP